MKKCVFLSVVGLVLFGLTGFAWAQCPEQPNDNGLCDTLYVECYDPFNYTSPPWQVRFPLFITNDIPDPAIDSISGMVIPLTFTSSNPAADARIDWYYNGTAVHPLTDLERSVFRHLPSMDDPQIRNWMMDYSETGMGLEWDTRIVVPHGDLGIDITVVPTGPPDQRFPGGSRLLHATVTFTLDDTTTMCVDTCFYQPTERLAFSRSDAVTYIPRDNMPYCANIRDQGCPGQHGGDNGDCDSLNLEVYPPDRYQVSFPAQVRLPMYVTNDIVNPSIDSIAGIVVPLGFTSSNPAASVLIDPAHNNTLLYPFPDLNQSVFRHLPSMEDPQERNWMMDFSEQGTGIEWDTRILDLTSQPDVFWMSLVPTGVADQRFPGGSRVLTATMTFTLEDTTTICVDVSPWPPGPAWIVFSRSDAVTYYPQVNIPYCTRISLAEHGDANGDDVINIADVLYMVNYLYRSGPYPVSFEAGDANCDGVHGILDVLILVNYLYKGGRAPGCV
jgi:hypothetical protein